MILFLDACALIYWQESVEPFYGRFIGAMRKIHRKFPEAGIAVSRLTQLECLVKPLQQGNTDLIEAYRRYFLLPELMIMELDAAAMERAAVLRAGIKGLRTPNALQAACALAITEKSVFFTSDPVFKKVPGLEIVCL